MLYTINSFRTKPIAAVAVAVANLTPYQHATQGKYA